MQKKYVREIFEILSRKWENAHCELDFSTPFQCLLAVVLSAQTTDKAVNKALKPLFEVYPNFSPKDLVEMGEKKFLGFIKSIGLAPTKAKNSFKLSQILIEKYGSKVPLVREELESLPGVGRKTANVVLNELGGEATIAVDTHVMRVSARIGLVPDGTERDRIEQILMKDVPQEFHKRTSHILIFHGRYLCMARKPDCFHCPIIDLCSRGRVVKREGKSSPKPLNKR